MLALAAERGEIGPKPDAAFFADTGDEPEAVYRHLEWLERQLSYPIVRIKGPQSLTEALRGGDNAARIPAFVAKGGLVGRQCTRNWKLRPIRRAIREFLGVDPRARLSPKSVEIWVGISMDEIVRMKPSGVAWLHNRHPLLEARMNRAQCIRWLLDRQYPLPPKSACWCCPFTDNERWQEMKDTAPADFEKACLLDEWFREPEQVKRFRGVLFLHHSKVPLREADFSKPTPKMGGFFNECEGMCGV